MNAFKCSAVALALVASISASAMTSIRDADLAHVSGQDGVSIIADLNVNIGAFTYTDDGASVSFNNIDIKGLIAATIDVLTEAAFQPAVVTSLMASGGLPAADAVAVVSAVGAATGYTGQDVVQFALPGGGMNTLSITIASITTGHGGTSMGGIQMKNLDLQGTKMWMYGH